jgi:hypothetical protein
VEAPVAFNVPLEPEQIDMLLTLTIGFALTVTVVVEAKPTQPAADVPVTEYTVVDEGLAVTLDPNVELNPVAGDQL